MFDIDKAQARNPQGAIAPPIANGRQKFADETSLQRAKHHEISVRYRKRSRPDRLMINLRKHFLQELFARRYRGRRLPNDDAGRGDLRLVADHLAQLGEDHVRRWAAAWMPDLSEGDLDELIRDVGLGKRWGPIALGKALNLTYAEVRAANIRTIRPVDRTKAQIDQDRRERNAERERARRQAAGATPRTHSVAQTEPWKDADCSRATWFRRRRHETGETVSCAILLSSLQRTKQSHGSSPVLSDVSRCPATSAPPGSRPGSRARAVPALSDLETIIYSETPAERPIPAAARARNLHLTAASSM